MESIEENIRVLFTESIQFNSSIVAEIWHDFTVTCRNGQTWHLLVKQYPSGKLYIEPFWIQEDEQESWYLRAKWKALKKRDRLDIYEGISEILENAI